MIAHHRCYQRARRAPPVGPWRVARPLHAEVLSRSIDALTLQKDPFVNHTSFIWLINYTKL